MPPSPVLELRDRVHTRHGELAYEGSAVKVTITVCDVCQDPGQPVRSYRVVSDGRSIETDRCQEHGAPFEMLFGVEEPSILPVGRRRYQGSAVDEIEARRSRRAAVD